MIPPMAPQRPELEAAEAPGVDVAALQARVRRRAAERPVHAAAAERPHLQAPEARRHALHGSAEVVPYEPLRPRVPVAGHAVVALKKATRRALRWYLWPVAERMSAHNRTVAGVVAEHRRQLTRVALERERVERGLPPRATPAPPPPSSPPG